MDDQQFLGKIETEGWEHAEAVYSAGRGGIFVTGHIGNWELSAAYAAKRGYPVSVVARRIYLEPLNQRLVTMRERMGVNTLYRDFSMRRMIRCIQENQLLGIVPDQDVRRIGGIFVDFFGHPAYTPVGPALLALASGAPILIARDIRMGQRHLLTVDPPVYADRKAPRESEVRRLVTHYTKRLEEFIREHPAQWVWTHRRWRTQPFPFKPFGRLDFIVALACSPETPPPKPLDAFVLIDIGNTAKEGSLLRIAQVPYAVGFHARNKDKVIGAHGLFSLSFRRSRDDGRPRKDGHSGYTSSGCKNGCGWEFRPRGQW